MVGWTRDRAPTTPPPRRSDRRTFSLLQGAHRCLSPKRLFSLCPDKTLTRPRPEDLRSYCLLEGCDPCCDTRSSCPPLAVLPVRTSRTLSSSQWSSKVFVRGRTSTRRVQTPDTGVLRPWNQYCTISPRSIPLGECGTDVTDGPCRRRRAVVSSGSCAGRQVLSSLCDVLFFLCAHSKSGQVAS